MCYIMYNMVVAKIYDPTVFIGFEGELKLSNTENLNGRVCFGAVWAYYKGNMGTQFGLDFWLSHMEDRID